MARNASRGGAREHNARVNPLDTRSRLLAPEYVVPWYRFGELQAFDVAERGRVVEDAVERATTHPRVLVAWGVTLAALAAGAVGFGATLKTWPMALTLAVALVAFVPLFLVRRGVVRSLVAQRVAKRVAERVAERVAQQAAARQEASSAATPSTRGSGPG